LTSGSVFADTVTFHILSLVFLDDVCVAFPHVIEATVFIRYSILNSTLQLGGSAVGSHEHARPADTLHERAVLQGDANRAVARGDVEPIALGSDARDEQLAVVPGMVIRSGNANLGGLSVG